MSDYFFTYKQATTCLRLLIVSEVQNNVLNVLFIEILKTLQVLLVPWSFSNIEGNLVTLSVSADTAELTCTL